MTAATGESSDFWRGLMMTKVSNSQLLICRFYSYSSLYWLGQASPQSPPWWRAVWVWCLWENLHTPRSPDQTSENTLWWAWKGRQCYSLVLLVTFVAFSPHRVTWYSVKHLKQYFNCTHFYYRWESTPVWGVWQVLQTPWSPDSPLQKCSSGRESLAEVCYTNHGLVL